MVCHGGCLKKVVDSLLYIGNSVAYRDASSRFRSGSGATFVDQLSCSGQESSLLDCRARPLGLAECDADEIAGVQCTGRCYLISSYSNQIC